MPIIENNTPNRGYPLPDAGNKTAIDVLRLIAALGSIDVDMASALTGLVAKAPLASPAFTGEPSAPTQPSGDDTNALATTAFVQAALAALVNSSPAALDTLNELAAALGNDANFAATMTAALATKANATAVVAKADAGLLSGVRNKVINGDFGIAQRAASFAVGAGGAYYGPDRWMFRGTALTGGAITGTIFRNFDTVWRGSYMRLIRTGCTSLQYIAQRIENLMQFSGKRVTVSFATSNDAIETIDAALVAVYGTGGSPSATEQVAIFSKSIPASANGIVHYVLDIPNLSGKTVGTNNDDYMDLQIVFRGTNNTTLRISKVSLVMGDASQEAEPFSPRHPQQELALCRWYYEVRTGMNAAGVCLQTTSGMFGLTFSPKRAAPTISIPIGVARIRNQPVFNSSPLVTGVTLFSISKEGEAHVQATVASGLTGGAAAILQLGTDAITFDAEL